MAFTIEGPCGDVRLGDPELFVDNEGRGRSGHMSHALVEYAPGQVLAFNSNVSAVRLRGHSGYGWIEYRRSLDAGQTWGEIEDLPYAKRAFLDGEFTITLEKAVSPAEKQIVAFCTRNTPYQPVCCEPWLTPYFVISSDGGRTWSEERELTSYNGRLYDAVAHEGSSYVLEFCSDRFLGTLPDHVYRVFVMGPGEQSFRELSTVPISGLGRGYGSLLLRHDGSLACYAYNVDDEQHMDFAVSHDMGQTWDRVGASLVAKGIRNPQTAYLNGTYFLHGRAGDGKGFVIYTSADGLVWDEGFIIEPDKRSCYYSNNLVLQGPDGFDRLLVQYSDAYLEARVNVMHMWVEAGGPALSR